MNQKTAAVKVLEETANNIKKEQFLMNCPIDIDKEKAYLWKLKTECKDIPSLPEFCPVEMVSCLKIKNKPTIKVINPNC